MRNANNLVQVLSILAFIGIWQAFGSGGYYWVDRLVSGNLLSRAIPVCSAEIIAWWLRRTRKGIPVGSSFIWKSHARDSIRADHPPPQLNDPITLANLKNKTVKVQKVERLSSISPVKIRRHVVIQIGHVYSRNPVIDIIGRGGIWQCEVFTGAKTYGEYDTLFLFIQEKVILVHNNIKRRIYFERNWKVNFRGQYKTNNQMVKTKGKQVSGFVSALM